MPVAASAAVNSRSASIRASVQYVSCKPGKAPLRLRIHDLAAARVRHGYLRIYILLRREG